jgi:NADH:ubiquinone oxidoreductase subunit D
VSDGGPSPARIHYRTPNFSNLFVINKLANSFQVVSLDPATGLLLNTDVGTFDWVILNPVW